MIDLTTPAWLMVALAIAFVAGMGTAVLCLALIVGWWSSRHRRAEDPEPHAPAEPVVSEPAVEVHVMRQVDLLPAPPVRLEDAPLARQIPVQLPDYDSVGWRFAWDKPTDPFATGSFPEIRSEMYDDLVVPPRPLPGFEIEGKARSRFKVSDELLAEVAKNLPSKRKATVDLDAGTVVVSA